MISKKSQSKIDSLKSNKKLRVFLLFLVLSFLFWSLIKLSKNYIADVEFNLVYVDVPKNKLLQNIPESKIKLTVKTVGFKLLKYGLKTKKLKYSLSDLNRKKGSIYYSITQSKIKDLQVQFSAETEVLKVKPDTLYFDLGVKKSKKVKINTNVNLQFKSGFSLVKKYTVHPNSVTVSGASKYIDSIEVIQTELFEMNEVSSSFEEIIKLKSPNEYVTLSSNIVTIKGNVEKMTEGTFNLTYRIINLPKNYIISTYPKKVKVTYQVALKDYNKISDNSFKIQCDYKETESNNLEYLIPKIVEKPEILFDVKVIPNKIEFLIKN